MARKKVVVTPMMMVERQAPANLGEGRWGKYQIRKTKNVVKSERLSKRLSCIQSKMRGGKFGSIGAVQAAFKRAVAECQ